MRKPEEEKTERDLGAAFRPLIGKLVELQRRFRPGAPYEQKPAKGSRRPHHIRKAERRRKNKAARIARRNNRRHK